MSRSIHQTHRMLHKIERFDYRDDTRRLAERKRIWGKLYKKWRIKKGTSEQRRKRREADREFLPSTPLESIPIMVSAEGPYVHHPATPEDILAVMRLLPPGICDGLAGIELFLGREDQEKLTVEDEGNEDAVRDPYVGRLGYEIIPGIFAGRGLGVYRRDHARIQICAYVYDGENHDLGIWAVFLKCHALSTLVHEIAHHHDSVMRVARGRWLMDNRTQGENYAENWQEEWVRDFVLPYVEGRYPREVRALLDWLASRVRIPVSLALLMSDQVKPAASDDLFRCRIRLRDIAFFNS